MFKGPEAKRDKSLEKWKILRAEDPYDFKGKIKNQIDP